MFQCVIFDVDGTLIDTELADKKSLQKVLMEETGKEYPLSELDFMLGIPGHDALKMLGIKDIARVNPKWSQYMTDLKNHMKMFDGIEEMLKELKTRNIMTGIVTSRTQIELENDIFPFGLMKYIDLYVCANDTEKHKPNPEPILKFLEKSGISSHDAIYVGDTIYDYKAATGANVKFALALWGAKNHENIHAFRKIANPKDLIADLNLLNQNVTNAVDS